MWGLHLKQKSSWWHYYRSVPRTYHDVDARRLISFSLKTSDFAEAKLKAARFSIQLDEEWQAAKARGVSLVSQDAVAKYQAAAEVQTSFGFFPKPAGEILEAELVERLRMLLKEERPASEQKAVLGLVEPPKMTMSDAFDRFWEYIRDEWRSVSRDQQRVKRNIYLKSMRNFEEAVGPVSFHDLDRKHAIAFRSWWVDRVEANGLKPYTGNREINSLRRMITVNLDIDGSSKTNPFTSIRLKEEAEVSRIPLDVGQIQLLIKPVSLPALHRDFHLLFRLLVNTGMRPVEAIGLELEDVMLEHEIPHVHVRKNATRGLKTTHSERLLPLLGVSMDAARDLVALGGWGKRLGKNMYASTVINKQLHASGIVTDKRQSLYSLRHWFQDQLTKRDVIDRAQAQLMGHKFHRPKYGYGKDLGELRDIIAQFAIEAL
jgi:site-specific recombinase XerD